MILTGFLATTETTKITNAAMASRQKEKNTADSFPIFFPKIIYIQ
jgi:hypothetical protein